jgi:signal recognition particle GTPase
VVLTAQELADYFADWRIALGSDTTVQDVNNLLREHKK